MTTLATPPWRRRARPAMGTLVEIGTRDAHDDAAIDAAFAAIEAGASRLSRFVANSDVARFATLEPGASIDVDRTTAEVLAAAARLRDATDGRFDVTLGRAPHGWRLDGRSLTKLDARARLDLDGVAKGYLVDAAVHTLRAQGTAHGWVNAGGDLRAFGDAELTLQLRDETGGGVRAFATLSDGAFATSRFGADSRSSTWPARDAHVSVAAPSCLWADALTKLVAVTGQTTHPLLAEFGAIAWQHAP